jgi:amino acid transporter
MSAVISVPATILLILSGILSTGASYSGWALIYGMYAIGGICAAIISGALYYDSRHDRHRTGPP